VLFDLDGTLLESRMEEALLPQYFAQLSRRMADRLPAPAFIEHLMTATRAMMANDGRATNADVFAEVFYAHPAFPRAEVEPIFADFYARDFPLLQAHTRRKAEAREVVQRAFDAGYDVVIATNPLFPTTAVAQRLAWAGVADFPYRLVTGYEYSHASKPNLRYYRQILDDLCHPAEACLVVGDEAWDMVAAQLGCPTFLVPSSATKSDADAYAPTYHGTLHDVAALLAV
jgi:FMN phosphatase YigB (HAD superfamily)